MKLSDILFDDDLMCEEVFVHPESGEILDEAAIRAFKRMGTEVKRQYRCVSGAKAGKIVSNPKLCNQRKDPQKVRTGRKVARTKKGIRIRKSAITKKKSISKMVSRMNQRFARD